MSTVIRTPDIAEEELIRSRPGTPTWEMARNFPLQGDWREDEFLLLTDQRHIEFNDGCVEFLPMPTQTHEALVGFLYSALVLFVGTKKLGRVYPSGYRVKLREGSIREPDVLFLASGRTWTEQFATGADLVAEVVSSGRENRDRDLIEKRREYAAAGIPEYWIVDPETTTITVLTLDGSEYRVHGEFKPGDTATSALLDGFAVNVADCFAAAAE